MKRVSLTLMGGVALAMISSVPAMGIDVGGYAVSNHRPCGVGNLPATTREMERLFSHEHFPEFFERNFYWTDSKVNQVDWAAATDLVEHPDTANGFNGVDASGVAYIASHGVTISDVYKASMGSQSAGGCSAQSSDMLLGDQNARYLILSTCQGVKIGTGDNPSRPGANPSRTWNPDRVNGLNCIFGYSNNMADADGYGVLFLNYLKNNEEPVADSFMRAGRAVASYNVPAVICFGATEEEAEAKLTSDMALSTEQAAGGASAYSYERGRDLVSSITELNTTRINKITVAPMLLDRSKVDALDGLVSYNEKAGTVTFRRQVAYNTNPMNISDDDAIAIATKYLGENLVSNDVALKPVRIIDRGFARGLEAPKVVGKAVVFAQDIFGLTSLSTAGTVEIYIDSSGEVNGFHYALRQVSGKLEEAKLSVTKDTLNQNIETVLATYRNRFPEANKIEFYRADVGYDLGVDVDAKDSAELVQQVVVEVTHGDYARRYNELVHLR